MRSGFEIIFSRSMREDSFADRAPRAEVPLPTAPPYIAYVGNLSFEATEADITDLFVSLAENVRSSTDY